MKAMQKNLVIDRVGCPIAGIAPLPEVFRDFNLKTAINGLIFVLEKQKQLHLGEGTSMFQIH